MFKRSIRQQTTPTEAPLSHCYYARHAQPAKRYDQIDLVLENHSLGLSHEGREQAQRLGRQTNDPPFDLIFTSPFARAHETALIIAAAQKNKAVLQVVDELAEVRFGNPNHTELKHWIQTGTTESGESVAQARARVARVLQLVKAKPSHKTLLVGHKLLFSVFLLALSRTPYATPVAKLTKNHLLDLAEIVRLPCS